MSVTPTHGITFPHESFINKVYNVHAHVWYANPSALLSLMNHDVQIKNQAVVARYWCAAYQIGGVMEPREF